NRFVKNCKKKKFFSGYGINYILDKIKKDLKDFGVYFDTWYNQSSLTKSRVDSVIEVLRKRNYIYQKDGATWFKSRIFGDEKDRVVVKSDGTFTYLAPDIAYHLNKYKKGFEHLIDIWGPDHHGYVPRLKAAIKALGYSEDSISTLLVQLATLYRDGEILSMSTRKGEFITLREIMTEVGKDVAKFFFLMRKLDSHLDFDLEVAKKESQDNPVYYIQYAHARIWSIKDFEKKAKSGIRSVKTNLNLLRETEELELSRLLYQFPRCVRNSAKNLEPYYIIMYLNSLAKVFHNFYTKHRVIGDDLALSKARLFLIDCVRICLANGLNLLGVSLPKRM
ncbi:MAG: arginine--tRNA ligase, partial [Candidatus Omnitrophica bacterium]|nr:arginine--tRNA ligase [Candidatus Omnitrophota bacterium]